MLPALLAAAVPAAIGFAGSMFQNSAQQASADKQMAFQREMSDTAYQRGMKDMKEAGLNPILAYSQGGASSAAGAQANVTNPGEAAIRGAESGANSASKLSAMKATVDNIVADTDLKRAQDGSAKAAALASLAQAKQTNLNSAITELVTNSTVEKAMYDAGIAGNTFDEGRGRAQRGKLEREYLDSPVGRTLAGWAFGGADVQKGTSAFSNVPLGVLVNNTFKSLGVR